MPSVEPLFREYAAFHRDRRNQLCHGLGIPLIVFSLLAAFALVPFGRETPIGRIDAVWAFAAFGAAVYVLLDLSLGAGMLLVLGGMALLVHAIPAHWSIPAAAFVVGWIFQLVGHRFEGKKPAFTKNPLHFVIGPLWILARVYETLGLRRAALPLATLLLVALPLSAGAQDDEPQLTAQTREAADLQTKADEQLKAKKNDDAIATYEKLLAHIEANKNKFPDFPESQQKAVRAHAYYNMACALSLTGKRDKALEALAKSVEAGFFDWQHLEKDEDLASVRGEPRYKEIVSVLRGTDKEAKRIEKLVKDTVKDKPLFAFDFEATTLESEKIKLADYKGKTVVVVCFGTWNPRCRDMAPSLVQLALAAKERGDPVQVVLLDWERTDPNEGLEKDVKDFVAEQKIPFPVVLMKEKDPTLDRIPDLKAFPTTLWVDKTGKVRARWDDEKVLTFDELEAITKALVHDDGPKKPEKKDDKKEPEKKDKKEDEPF